MSQDWVDKMVQQSKSDMAAESYALQARGLPKEEADAAAGRKQAMLLKLRSGILNAVMEKTRSPEYQQADSGTKLQHISEAVMACENRFRSELITPVEALITAAAQDVLFETQARVRAATEGE